MQTIEPLIPFEEAKRRLSERVPGAEFLNPNGEAMTVEQFECAVMLAETLKAKNKSDIKEK